MIGTDKTNFSQNLQLSDRQALRLCEAFVNNLSTGVKLSKTQIFKIIQSSGFLAWLFGLIMEVNFLLMKNLLISLAKNVLMPLRFTAAVSGADAGIHEKR